MEKFLIIKTPGLFVDIPGIPNFRTPARINITNLDENIVISTLKKEGIDDFKINIKEKIIKKFENSFRKLVGKNDNEIILNRLKDQQKSIKNIESLLEKFLQSGVSINQHFDEIKKPVLKDELDDFIPTIDLSKIKSNIK